MTHDLPLVLLSAALEAAERGWHVFPVRANDKRPALHSEIYCPRTGLCAQRHRGWEQRAVVDRQRIMRCWTSGEFNVGLATGPSGLVVVDLDTPKTPEDVAPEEWAGMPDGMAVFAAVCESAGQPVPTETFTVRTGRGGLHLYFTAPEGKPLRSSRGELGWKVDTRAHGGYVVAAGSLVNDRPYMILRDQPPVPLPAWLGERLTPKPLPAPMPPEALRERMKHTTKYASSAVAGEVEKVQSARQGGRNEALYRAAFALARLVGIDALTEDDVTAALTAAGLSVGLSHREVATAIRSGLHRGAQRHGRAA